MDKMPLNIGIYTNRVSWKSTLQFLRSHPRTCNQSTKYGSVQAPVEEQQKIFQEKVDALLRVSRQVGADGLFVIVGHIDSRVLSSPLVILDLAILPQFVLPSKRLELEAKASRTFIDVATGRVIFMVSSTSKAKGFSPSIYTEEKLDSMSLAQRDVLAARLGGKLMGRLERLDRLGVAEGRKRIGYEADVAYLEY